MANENDILVSLTPADLAEVDAALETIRSKFPQRGAVSSDEARRLFKLGENSLGFVELAQQTSREHSGEMADSARPAAFDASRASYDTIARVELKIEELAAEMSGLLMRAGSQLLGKGLSVYEATKRAAKANPAMQGRADQLGQRFSKTKASGANKAAASAGAA